MRRTKTSDNTRFTKEQLLSFQRFLGRQDIVNAVLKKGQHYTVDEADKLITRFMKGRVK